MPLECEWFELCDRPSAGDAAHPFKGVIPVCGPHAKQYLIPLITEHDQEEAS